MPTSTRAIFLLEDNPERLAQMLPVLHSIFPHHHIQVEDDFASAIDWLKSNQSLVDLISLDHDLDSVSRCEDPLRDHGCGRDVANFLATQLPTCPIIIHTSNATAGDGMIYELKYAKWPVFRVYPHDHHDWVGSDWQAMIRQLLQRNWIAVKD